tara:strand:- start:50540 stop:51082 length:543 start_codon:yes stop_codon:yes gene_type:complete
MTILTIQPTSRLMNAAIESRDTTFEDIQSERRATERTYKSWDRFARDCLGEFVNTMLNERWDEDSHDFLMVYDKVSPDHSSIVISGTGAQVFLGLPSSRFPAAQRLPSHVREEFLAAAGRSIKNEAPSRNSGIYIDKFGNEVAYRCIFVPTKPASDNEPACIYGTFSAKFVADTTAETIM